MVKEGFKTTLWVGRGEGQEEGGGLTPLWHYLGRGEGVKHQGCGEGGGLCRG